MSLNPPPEDPYLDLLNSSYDYWTHPDPLEEGSNIIWLQHLWQWQTTNHEHHAIGEHKWSQRQGQRNWWRISARLKSKKTNWRTISPRLKAKIICYVSINLDEYTWNNKVAYGWFEVWIVLVEVASSEWSLFWLGLKLVRKIQGKYKGDCLSTDFDLGSRLSLS